MNAVPTTHTAAAAIMAVAQTLPETDQAYWEAGWLAGRTNLAPDRDAPGPYWDGYRAALISLGAAL